MKYYESSYDEYLSSYEKYNLHPELDDIKTHFPKHVSEFKNILVYGPSGAGKYTQVLSLLQQYSPTKLKYDKKISITYEKQEKKTKTPTSILHNPSTPTPLMGAVGTGAANVSKPRKPVSAVTDKKKKTDTSSSVTPKPQTQIQIKKTEKKQEYMYRISDIHYEIDMATLGCNSKLLWHDLFFQIVDIVSMSLKTYKIGIIVCKNFHAIHNELLEIFYSYMRHPLHHMGVQIKFVLITDHIGFIPDNITNACEIISVKRPTKEQYLEMTKKQTKPFSCFMDSSNRLGIIYDKTNRTAIFQKNRTAEILEEIDLTGVFNSKEIHTFSWLKSTQDIPTEVFNIIADSILEQILNPHQLKILELRNNLYDLLIYNVDVSECIWYLFTTLIHLRYFSCAKDITEVLNSIFVFFKYYNNNYRSIYHLESIVLCMINKIHYTRCSK